MSLTRLARASNFSLPMFAGDQPTRRPARAAAGDPIAEWKAAVKAKRDAGLDQQRAVAAVAKENPTLQNRFVQAGREAAAARIEDRRRNSRHT
jgi:hypothetical protein